MFDRRGAGWVWLEELATFCDGCGIDTEAAWAIPPGNIAVVWGVEDDDGRAS